MKKAYIFSSIILAAAIGAGATTIHLKKGNISYSFPEQTIGEMPFSKTESGEYSLSVNGYNFLLDKSEISFDDAEVENNIVEVEFSGNTAKVNIAGNIAGFIQATSENAHVKIIQSKDVSEQTLGEITYRLSGNSDNGSLYLEGSYKASIDLYGLTLSNPGGAALDIQNGKRIALSVKSGTVNTLSDGENGDWKGCIVCKGHLELKGKGELNISGNTSHAVYAKEYVEVKNCTLNILKSVKDGINCTQYFSMESGNISISNPGDDGIQVDFKDAENREDEDTGSAAISGGNISITTSANAAKCLKTEGNIEISGGELNLKATGNGLWDTKKSKTKAAACLGSDGNLTISGGKLSLHATGSGGKGANCDGNFCLKGGETEILTEGGIYTYTNGQENHNYTGNTDRINSDLKSSPKGIKADSGVEISGGTINIVCKGNGGEGIESKADLTISDGKIFVMSVDDCINSAKTMTISGGDITVISSGNDGLDANGDMYVSGGYTRAFGAGSPECGIDVNSEGGYRLYFTGGTIIGVGGSTSTPSNANSTQPYVMGSLTVSKGQTVTLTDGENQLASFEVPEQYNTSSSSSGVGGGRPGGGQSGKGSRVIISCPGIEKGKSYTIANGESTVSATAAQYGSVR